MEPAVNGQHLLTGLWLTMSADTPRPIGRGFLIAQERFCFTVRSSGNRLGYRIKVPQWELLRWRINPCSPSLTRTPQT